MKQLLTSLLLLSSITVLGQHQSDEKDIVAITDRLTADWNSHQFSNMDQYTTPDINWVNIVGMWWKGREEVKLAHQAIFDQLFKKRAFSEERTNGTVYHVRCGGG